MMTAIRWRGLGGVAVGRRGTLAVIAVVTAVVLLWSLGRTVDGGHTAAADSQLAADLQLARATFDADLAAAARRASALASLSRTQEALRSGQASALAAVADSHPGALLIAATGARAGSLAPLGVTRVAEVVSGGTTIGRVVVEASLDSSYLARVQESLPAGTRDLLVVTDRGRVVAGPLPAGTSVPLRSRGTVNLDGRAYRALGSPLSADRPEIRVVALARPGGGGFLSGWRLPLAVLATLAAVALVVMWTAGPRRTRPAPVERAPAPQVERAPARRVEPVRAAELPPTPSRDRRMPDGVALVGEMLAATHDVDALAAVIVNAAVEATGAVRGEVVRGDPRSSLAQTPAGSLTVPLDAEGSRSLVLYPPAGGFTAQDAAVAHWLGTQAGTAIKTAHHYRVVEQHAQTDELTGLSNRRHFTERLHAELERAERFGTRLGVLLIDLDEFKRINDRFGHHSGDEVLRAFASTLKRGVRKIDVPARIGGDEFAVLLPQTGSEGALKLAERLRSRLRAEPGPSRGVTASFGVSHYPEAASAEELLVSADVCLYRAKEGGRDQVVLRGGSRPRLSDR